MTTRSRYRSERVESVVEASMKRMEGAPELYSAPESVYSYSVFDVVVIVILVFQVEGGVKTCTWKSSSVRYPFTLRS